MQCFSRKGKYGMLNFEDAALRFLLSVWLRGKTHRDRY
jgi:hypothetical protein